MNRTRRTAAALTLTALAGLSACTAPGSYTKEFANSARARLDAFRAGIDLQTAENQFLAGELDKSQATVDNALKIAPESTAALLLRGRILLERGDLEGSRLVLTKAAELEPESIDAHYFLAVVSERLEQPELAYAHYIRAAELEPANPQHAVAAAETLMIQQRYDEARSVLASRLGSMTQSAAPRELLGQIELLTGNYDQAVVHFSAARLLAPRDQRILEQLARALMLGAQYDQAESVLHQLLVQDRAGNRRDLLWLQAQCLMATGRLQEAREVLTKLTTGQQGERDLGAWIMLGQASAHLRDMPRLRTAAARLITLAPALPDGYLLRAVAERMSGSPAAALATLEQAPAAIAADPREPILRALVLEQLGRNADALAYLQQTIDREPGHGQARKLLAAITDRSQSAPTASAAAPDSTNQ